jgi:VWFA-related protein
MAKLRVFTYDYLAWSWRKTNFIQSDRACVSPLAACKTERDDTPSRRKLGVQTGGGTLLYDAIVQASNTVLKSHRNRKAMILVSDGDDNGSSAALTDAIEAAQRADILVYSILFSDSSFSATHFPFGGLNGREVFMRLSKETGACFFEVSKKQGIEQIHRAIQEELRSQYSLGFIFRPAQ